MVRLVLQMRFMSMAAQVDVEVQSLNGWKSEALGGGRWLSGEQAPWRSGNVEVEKNKELREESLRWRKSRN